MTSPTSPRFLTRTALTAATFALAGTAVAALAAPAASADPLDQNLYPRSGQVYIDPVSTQVLTALPVSAAAGLAGDAMVAGAGPSTTVAVLSTVEHVVDGPVRQAARTPGAGVDVHWMIGPNGTVFNTTEIRQSGGLGS